MSQIFATFSCFFVSVLGILGKRSCETPNPFNYGSQPCLLSFETLAVRFEWFLSFAPLLPSRGLVEALLSAHKP